MTLTVHERLERAVIGARRENELPESLVEPLLRIAGNPAVYGGDCVPLLEKLVEVLPDYDTYAQTGYLGMGVNDADIRMLIKAVERARRECVD